MKITLLMLLFIFGFGLVLSAKVNALKDGKIGGKQEILKPCQESWNLEYNKQEAIMEMNSEKEENDCFCHKKAKQKSTDLGKKLTKSEISFAVTRKRA